MGRLGQKDDYNVRDLLKRAALAARSRRRRRCRKAIALYRRVMEFEPDNVDHHRKLAPLLAHVGQPVEAYVSYRLVAEDRFNRGFVDQAIGIYREAVQTLPRQLPVWKELAALEVKRDRPADAAMVLLAGRSHFRGRRFRSQAIELLAEANRLRPGDLAITFDLASLLARAGEPRRALHLLDQLTAAHPKLLRRIRAKQLRIVAGPRTAWRWLRALLLNR
jgi:tetratricopeptide (TPR) repeat protein